MAELMNIQHGQARPVRMTSMPSLIAVGAIIGAVAGIAVALTLTLVGVW